MAADTTAAGLSLANMYNDPSKMNKDDAVKANDTNYNRGVGAGITEAAGGVTEVVAGLGEVGAGARERNWWSSVGGGFGATGGIFSAIGGLGGIIQADSEHKYNQKLEGYRDEKGNSIDKQIEDLQEEMKKKTSPSAEEKKKLKDLLDKRNMAYSSSGSKFSNMLFGGTKALGGAFSGIGNILGMFGTGKAMKEKKINRPEATVRFVKQAGGLAGNLGSVISGAAEAFGGPGNEAAERAKKAGLYITAIGSGIGALAGLGGIIGRGISRRRNKNKAVNNGNSLIGNNGGDGGSEPVIQAPSPVRGDDEDDDSSSAGSVPVIPVPPSASGSASAAAAASSSSSLQPSGSPSPAAQPQAPDRPSSPKALDRPSSPPAPADQLSGSPAAAAAAVAAAVAASPGSSLQPSGSPSPAAPPKVPDRSPSPRSGSPSVPSKDDLSLQDLGPLPEPEEFPKELLSGPGPGNDGTGVTASTTVPGSPSAPSSRSGSPSAPSSRSGSTSAPSSRSVSPLIPESQPPSSSASADAPVLVDSPSSPSPSSSLPPVDEGEKSKPPEKADVSDDDSDDDSDVTDSEEE